MSTKELNKREVLLSGFARLPEKSVIFHKFHGAVEITLKVFRDTGEITELDSAALTRLQVRYLQELLCGEEIMTSRGLANIEQLLLRNFQSSLRKPVVAGIRACRQKLEELKEDDGNRAVAENESFDFGGQNG